LTYDPVLAAEGAALVRAFFAECSIFGGLRNPDVSIQPFPGGLLF
jgi:hypothetical protein